MVWTFSFDKIMQSGDDVGCDWLHSGCSSHAVGLLVNPCQSTLATVGNSLHDWVLLVWPTNVDWALWC